MISLGIDFSTHTGITLLSFPGDGSHRVLEAKEVTAPKTLKGMNRADYIACELVLLIEKYQPTIICLEDYAPKYMGSAIVNIEITAVSKYMIHQLGLGYWKVSVGTLKKFVTGKGNSTKDVIMKDIFKKWGFDTDNNNIADSFGLAMWGGAMENAINCNKAIIETVTAFKENRDKFFCT